MKSIGEFLKRLRLKKELADLRQLGATLGTQDHTNHADVIERATRAASVFLAAERINAPSDVLYRLGEEAVTAAVERDQFFHQENNQIATAFSEAEQRDREVS